MRRDGENHRGRTRLLVTLLVATSTLSGCTKTSTSTTTSAAAVKATAFGPAECGACGMVVSEQPAPRAQLVHRDGTRVFFCSIADLIQYQQAPSPHGKPRAVFVETLAETVDIRKADAQLKPWISATKAHFLLGAARPGVMGPPVLSFGSAIQAKAAQVRLAAAGQSVNAPVLWPDLAGAVLGASAKPSTPKSSK